MGLFDFLGGSKVNVSLKAYTEKTTYEPGETVRGVATFHKDQAVKISGVTVQLLGHEWIKVTDSFDVPVAKRTKTKAFLDSSPIEIQKKKKEDPGETRYNFEVVLPEGTPASVDIHGILKISYEIKIDVHVPNGASFSTAASFHVKNAVPSAIPPAFFDKKTSMFKDVATIRVIRDKQSYSSNENAALDVLIENKSGKDIYRIILSLERHIQYGSNKDTKFLASHEVQSPHIPISTGSKFEEVINFQLPADLISSTKSKTSKVAYSFVFTLEFNSGGNWIVSVPQLFDVPPHQVVAQSQMTVTPPPSSSSSSSAAPHGSSLDALPAATAAMMPVASHPPVASPVVFSPPLPSSSSAAASAPPASAVPQFHPPPGPMPSPYGTPPSLPPRTAEPLVRADTPIPNVMMVPGPPPPGFPAGQPLLAFTPTGQQIYVQYTEDPNPSHVPSHPSTFTSPPPAQPGYGHPSQFTAASYQNYTPQTPANPHSQPHAQDPSQQQQQLYPNSSLPPLSVNPFSGAPQ